MPSAAQTPVFQSTPRGTSGQAAMPTACGPDRLPDVDVRVPGDQHVLPVLGQSRASAIRLSFDPGTRWSTSTPSRRPAPGPNSRDRGRQVVQAVDRLHHDALHPQVVAPDPLDQGRVVDALHPDPGGPGGARPEPGDHPGAGRRAAPEPRPADRGRTRVTCWPSTRKAPGASGNIRRRPCRSSRVTAVERAGDGRAAEAGQRVLGHHVRRWPAVRGSARLRGPPASTSRP